MTLANLLNAPRDPNSWEEFSFNNYQQTLEIQKAILQQYNVNLTQYQIYPVDFTNFKYWLEQNQQSHEDFNSVLGLQGSDIEELDPSNERQLESWTFLNYQELYSASAKLKI